MPATPILAEKLRRGAAARWPLPETDQLISCFARGTEDRIRPLVRCPVTVAPCAARVVKLAEVVSGINAPAIIGIVGIGDSDAPALLCADTALACQMIDLSLGGAPTDTSETSARSFSGIDMLVCRLYLEATLEAFIEAAGVGPPLPRSFVLLKLLQNLAESRLGSEHSDVLVIDLAITLGAADRGGHLRLNLPLSALDIIRAANAAPPRHPARDRSGDLWKRPMSRAASSAPVRIDAVLHRATLTLAALRELRVGQVLEIPRQAPDAVALTMAQPGGRGTLLATGRLGAFEHSKVIKLATTPDPHLRTHINLALGSATRDVDKSSSGL